MGESFVSPWEREREMFYLTTHSTHFIYGYMASDIWLRTILIVRNENHCCHIGYSYQLTARVLLYAPSHRQDNTHHSLCYTCHGALAGTRNSSMGPPHEGLIWRPIAPWANASHHESGQAHRTHSDNMQGAPCLLLDYVCTAMVAVVVSVIIHLFTGNSKQ